jgi:hypothetical protein
MRTWTARGAFSGAAVILVAMTACGGDDNAGRAPSTGASTTSAGSGGSAASVVSTSSSTTGGPTGSGGSTGSGGATGSGGTSGGPDAGPRPKAIGSPCAADVDCVAGLHCDTSFVKGMCTKSCAMDNECTGRGGAVGVCLVSTCYASCVPAVDAGASDDAGTTAPCKNKSFACMEAPGHTSMACQPSPDTDAGGTDDDASSD